MEAPRQVVPAQVRDYSFSPDSGRVDALRYDALGLPAIPEAVLTVLEASYCAAPCMTGHSRPLWRRCHRGGCLV